MKAGTLRSRLLATAFGVMTLAAQAACISTAQAQDRAVEDPSSAGVLVFTPEDFAWARPNTALDMATRIPGFAVDDGDQLRGFSGAAGNLLINGRRPATKGESGSSALSRIPAHQVVRIELIRGGAPGIDMQGFSAVVNVVVSRDSAELQQTLQYSVTAFENADALHGARYEAELRRGDHVFSALVVDDVSYSDDQGVAQVTRIDANDAVTTAQETTQFGGGSSYLQLGYGGPLAGGRIESTAKYVVYDFTSRTDAVAPDRQGLSLSVQDGSEYEAGLTFTRPLAGPWGLEARLIHSSSDEDGLALDEGVTGGVSDPIQRFDYLRSASETIARTVVRRERGDGVGWEFGGEVALNTLDSAQSFEVGGVAVPLPSASINVEEVRGEVFASANWNPRPDLSVEGGARIETSRLRQSGDASAETRLTYVKPRLLATWTPQPGNQWQFRFEREVGQLDFNDFAASVDLANDDAFGGNVDLRPETRWVAEAGWERRFMETGALTATFRHSAVSDVIDIIPVGPQLSGVGNIGDGRSTEIEASLSLPRGFLGLTGGRIRIDARRQWTSVTDPTTGQSRPFSYRSPWAGSFDFEQDISRWNALWGFTYHFDERRTQYDPDATRTLNTDGYLSAFVEYKPDPSLSVRLTVSSWLSINTERTLYADRVSRDVALVERRDVDTDTVFRLQLRKAL